MQIFFFSFHCFYTGLVLRRIRTKYLALTSLLMNLILFFFLLFANFILFSILPQRQHGTILSENKDQPPLLYFKGRSIGIGFVPFITLFSTRPVCYPFISNLDSNKFDKTIPIHFTDHEKCYNHQYIKVFSCSGKYKLALFLCLPAFKYLKLSY